MNHVGRLLAAIECAIGGHEWSWVVAIGLGFEDRPVCRRCGRLGS